MIRSLLFMLLLLLPITSTGSSIFALNRAGFSINVIDVTSHTQKLWSSCYGTVTINPHNRYDTIINVYGCKNVQSTFYAPPNDVDGDPVADVIVLSSAKGENYSGSECFIIRSHAGSFPGDTLNRTIVEVIC